MQTTKKKNVDTVSNADVYDFITRRPCATIATSREGSSADLAHVFVYFDLAFNGYFLSKIDTRKVDNISGNPHVSLLFSDIDSLQQVEYLANARIIDDTEEITTVLPKIQDILQDARAEYWIPPVTQVPGNGYCIVELTPMAITYRDYAREKKDAGAHQFKLDMSAL